MEDLLSIELGIKKLSAYLDQCVEYSRNRRRAICFHNLVNRLEDKQNNVLWNYAPDIDREEKGKWGTLFLVTMTMNTLLSATITSNMQYYGNARKAKVWQKNLFEFFAHWHGLLYAYEKDVSRWRLDQISPVNICEEKEYFWKKFSQTCETRWKRSNIVQGKESQEIEKRHIVKNPLFESRRKIEPRLSIIADKFDQVTQKSTLLIEEEDNGADNPDNDPSLNVADGIGGVLANTKIFSGKVVDSVLGETVFDKEVTVQEHERRGDYLLTLTKEGMEARGKYETKIKNQMDIFNNGTALIVREVLSLHMNDIKPKMEDFF